MLKLAVAVQVDPTPRAFTSGPLPLFTDKIPLKIFAIGLLLINCILWKINETVSVISFLTCFKMSSSEGV